MDWWHCPVNRGSFVGWEYRHEKENVGHDLTGTLRFSYFTSLEKLVHAHFLSSVSLSYFFSSSLFFYFLCSKSWIWAYSLMWKLSRVVEPQMQQLLTECVVWNFCWSKYWDNFSLTSYNCIYSLDCVGSWSIGVRSLPG